MANVLQRWPLGPPPPNAQPEPRPNGGRGHCMTRVVILADWHEADRRGRPHYAQDIFAPRGTPVLSPVAGRVTFAGYGPNGGNQVNITNANGSLQLSHFDNAPLVRTGERVTVGQPLGVVGNTGSPRACPHLHIAARGPAPERARINLYSELRALSDTAPVRPSLPTDNGPETPPEPPSDGAAPAANSPRLCALGWAFAFVVGSTLLSR